MPVLSFSVFRDKVESGEKRQTIRGVRKNPIKTGDKLFMYWKQQSPKDCTKLGETVCTQVTPIKITHHAIHGDIDVKNVDSFAQSDGFDDFDQMVKYFDKEYGIPFDGVLIQWDTIN